MVDYVSDELGVSPLSTWGHLWPLLVFVSLVCWLYTEAWRQTKEELDIKKYISPNTSPVSVKDARAGEELEVPRSSQQDLV